MKICVLLVLALCVYASQSFSQDDTSHVFQPAVDTAAVRDTADTSAVDSLSPAERAAKQFEERMRQFQKTRPKIAAKGRFSAFDTLLTYFTSRRLNQREWLNRSFALDAGDYFKLDPGYFVQKYQLVPMRTTVQPYGLTGDRLNVLSNGEVMTPFEHVPEPQGMMDLGDVSTMLDDSIYVLPGAAGMIFGADQSVATLLTQTAQPPNKKLWSALILDKGQTGYSHVRSRYSNRFSSGRSIDLGLGYRLANDPFGSIGDRRLDDAYQWDGSVYWPFASRYGVRMVGHLFKRNGALWMQPNEGGDLVFRDRFDRSIQVSLASSSDTEAVRSEIGYRHVRQGSNLSRKDVEDYRRRLDNTEHEIFGHREWLANKSLFEADAAVNSSEYDNGRQQLPRRRTEASVVYARPYETYRWAVRLGGKYVEEFGVLPLASVTMLRESERFMVLTSVGYSNREPGMKELHLPFSSARLLGPASGLLYADSGNAFLSPERQVTGTIRAEWGKPQSSLRAEVVAGRIFDGIEWKREQGQKGNQAFWLFSPINTNVRFVNATLTKRFQMGDWLSFLSGGSYHRVAYDSFATKAYQPEYQFFGGLELHYYWQPKLIHLWAYGEVSYVGPYEGYDETQLGEQAVFNGKLSFSMGSFRFRVLYQNLLNQVYQNREGMDIPGWEITWGFTWNFSD